MCQGAGPDRQAFSATEARSSPNADNDRHRARDVGVEMERIKLQQSVETGMPPG